MRSPALILLALTLIATPLLTGCKSGGGTAYTDGINNVPIVDKAAGDQVKVTNYILALVSEEEFKGLGLDQTDLKPDFASQSVVLFSLGEQSTGGFAADIVAMQRDGDTLYVQGTAKAPGSSASAAQVISYPFCAAVIAKVPAGIKVRSDITSMD